MHQEIYSANDTKQFKCIFLIQITYYLETNKLKKIYKYIIKCHYSTHSSIESLKI